MSLTASISFLTSILSKHKTSNMAAGNLSRTMPGAFPPEPDSPSSSEASNEQFTLDNVGVPSMPTSPSSSKAPNVQYMADKGIIPSTPDSVSSSEASDDEFTLENIDVPSVPKSSSSSGSSDDEDVPSTPNSPRSSKALDEPSTTDKIEVSIPTFLFKDLTNALKVCGQLTDPLEPETITTCIFGNPSSATSNLKANFNAETVEILLRTCLLGMRAWEKTYARMKEAVEEVSTQQQDNDDELQQGVLVERDDDAIADYWASLLDLDEAMGATDLSEGEA